MEPQKLTISVSDRDSVTALFYPAKPAAVGITILLGHGAGGNQMDPFMRLFASGLAARGFDVMTFNFLYTEQRRRAPDPKAKLEACYREVIDAALTNNNLKGNLLVIGGKSMGGRIASQVAAATGSNIAGLIFLGYPLHPPGKPELLRDAHLPLINAPMLFVQGSRDSFGTPKEIQGIIKKHRLKATLRAIEGGDHSLKVAKGSGQSQQEVYEGVMDEIAEWLRARYQKAKTPNARVTLAANTKYH